jgi:hypothetical protein
MLSLRTLLGHAPRGDLFFREAVGPDALVATGELAVDLIRGVQADL